MYVLSVYQSFRLVFLCAISNKLSCVPCTQVCRATSRDDQMNIASECVIYGVCWCDEDGVPHGLVAASVRTDSAFHKVAINSSEGRNIEYDMSAPLCYRCRV